MGIDLLDLTFRMEKHFRLKIDMTFWGNLRDSAQQMSPLEFVTDLKVGQIHHELVQRLKQAGRHVETSYLAEENFKDVLSKLRARYPTLTITPDTKLQELFGRHLWREDWSELSGLLGIEVESTMTQSIPSRWTSLLFGLMFVVSTACLLPMIWQAQTNEVVALISIAMLCLFVAWRLSCIPRWHPILNWTVNRWAHQVLLARTSRDGDSKWSEELVWIALREMICDTLCVESDAVTPDATLFGDLGAS